MGDVQELRAHIEGAKQVVKATQRTLRGTLQYLADLEERLDALDIAQPQEAQRVSRRGSNSSSPEHTSSGRSWSTLARSRS